MSGAGVQDAAPAQDLGGIPRHGSGGIPPHGHGVVLPPEQGGMPPHEHGAAAPEEVRAAIDEILASSEFRPQRNPFEALLDTLADWLRELLPGGLRGSSEVAALLAKTIVWGVLVLVVALLAIALARSLARRADAPAVPAPDPERARRERYATLRAEARAALARAEYLLALRLEFTALVVGLGQRGDLEYRDAYTNRELLERGRPGATALAVLQPLVPDLDRKSFGGELAQAADVARMAELCDRLVGREAPGPSGEARA